MDIVNKEIESPKKKIQILVFLFALIALIVDGTDFMMLSYSMVSLKKEFGLSSFQAGTFASFTLMGMLVGGIIGGWTCDRFGRVRTITVSVALFSIGTFLLGHAQNYWQFGIIRFLASMPLGAVYLASNILVSEYFSTKYRSTVMSTMLSGYIIGFILAAYLAGIIIPEHGWRWLFYIALVPIVLVLFVQKFIPEPQAWRKLQELRRQGISANPITNLTNTQHQSGLKQIFKNPESRLMFICWTLISFFLLYGYYGVNVWMPSYLEKDLGMNFKAMTNYMIGSYIATILGKISAGVLADKLGRRFVFSAGCICTAGFLLVLVNYNNAENILMLLIIFGFVYGFSTGIHTTYLTESFSTANRGLAAGISYNIGRIGGAIAPPTIGLIATHTSFAIGFFVICTAYVITALIPALFIKDRMYDPQST
ncbi:MFS transporter [Acinetobacter guerrae]|uniref:MFS transporter n=1 Tax=Acinetobacter guerrae TaxID=1843371 RepID=UPI00128CE3EB|nr:MFS transporter [Acinetobacter guerrae]MPW43065.1 MFS transporter [Acinetobacter guerrae]